MTGWELPTTARLGGREYAIHTDYRDILEILAWLGGERGEGYTTGERWFVALRLFYRDFAEMPQGVLEEAAAFLADFLAGGRAEETTAHTPRLMDWQQDAPLIVAAVNRVAGCEIRALKSLHWWTFLAWFTAVGEGAFATVVGIRAKRASGKRLDKWEQDYLRDHRAEVELRPRWTPQEKAERERLRALLDGGGVQCGSEKKK